jgi:hypothetical protein
LTLIVSAKYRKTGLVCVHTSQDAFDSEYAPDTEVQGVIFAILYL